MENTTLETVAAFHDSLDRCGSASGFLGRFYELFLASSPEVAKKFADTNMKTQVRALKTSFYLAMLAADRKEEASLYLERIAARHNHKDLDIKPAMYELWLNSLVQAVSECDPKFDSEIEAVWREFFRPAIDYMQSRYR